MLDGLNYQAPAEYSAPASRFPLQQCTVASAGLVPIICYDAQSPTPTGPEPELSSQWSVVKQTCVYTLSYYRGLGSLTPCPSTLHVLPRGKVGLQLLKQLQWHPHEASSFSSLIQKPQF